MMNIIPLIILLSLITVSCNVLSTRDPESPDIGQNILVPATSPSLVLANMKLSIESKNPNNLLLCLADTMRGSKLPFQFAPTAEINTRYASLFINWNVLNERTSFQSLLSKLPSDGGITLQFQQIAYDVVNPDSVVILANYELITNHQLQSIPKNAKGRLRFVCTQERGGIWSIQSWTDNTLSIVDSNSTSWSLFKAQFSN